MQIDLSDYEMQLVSSFLEFKDKVNPPGWAITHSTAKRHNGFAGELAFNKCLGVYPRMFSDPYAVYDSQLHNGLRIDVKTTAHENGNLLIPEHMTRARCCADVFVLVIGQGSVFRLRGFATADEVFSRNLIQFPGKHWNRVVRYNELHSMEELKTWKLTSQR